MFVPRSDRQMMEIVLWPIIPEITLTILYVIVQSPILLIGDYSWIIFIMNGQKYDHSSYHIYKNPVNISH